MMLKHPLFSPFGQPQAFLPFGRRRFPPIEAGPQSVLNVEKLSLDPATAVGTQVSVTDGFVVSGFGNYQDGFYAPSSFGNYIGPSAAGQTQAGCVSPENAEGQWRFQGAITIDAGDGTELNPWSVDWSGATPPLTLARPANQQLTAPSTAQGAVAVLGGTQDGVYTKRYDLDDGSQQEHVFKLLGADDSVGINQCYRGLNHGAFTRWNISDADGPIYYSLTDVATPDLATDWKNASDDSPASITVTSVTIGQLASGWQVGDVTYQVNGSQNGRTLYHDVLGVAMDLGWDGTYWTDGTRPGTLNAAFPDIGTADPVASESNWEIVP